MDLRARVCACVDDSQSSLINCDKLSVYDQVAASLCTYSQSRNHQVDDISCTCISVSSTLCLSCMRFLSMFMLMVLMSGVCRTCFASASLTVPWSDWNCSRVRSHIHDAEQMDRQNQTMRHGSSQSSCCRLTVVAAGPSF